MKSKYYRFLMDALSNHNSEFFHSGWKWELSGMPDKEKKIMLREVKKIAKRFSKIFDTEYIVDERYDVISQKLEKKQKTEKGTICKEKLSEIFKFIEKKVSE